MLFLHKNECFFAFFIPLCPSICITITCNLSESEILLTDLRLFDLFMHKLQHVTVFCVCFLCSPPLFFFFLTGWPTLSKRFSPLFLCFLITSSKCNKPCVNLHRTKGRGGRAAALTRYTSKNQESRKGVKVL